MTSVLEQHTVLPPAEHDPILAAVRATLHTQNASLVGPDGSQVVLPPEVYRVLRDVVEAMSQGLAITIAPHNTQLTTQEAADLLGISRPTLVRLIESGEIPFEMRGRHRRVMLTDVMNYQQRFKALQRDGLNEMARMAAEDGLYEADSGGFIQTR